MRCTLFKEMDLGISHVAFALTVQNNTQYLSIVITLQLKGGDHEMAYVGGATCGGGGSGAAAFVLVLFVLLVIILAAGMV